MTRPAGADLGGVARAVGWRMPHRSPLDDKTEWMGYLADRAVQRGLEAVRAAELLASGQAIAAGERGGPR